MLLLTFTAGANRYAVDVARVVELVPRVELRSVPHAPPFLAGLLGYRGKVVPVIDLGLLLGALPCRIASAPASSWSTTRPAITIDGSRIAIYRWKTVVDHRRSRSQIESPGSGRRARSAT